MMIGLKGIAVFLGLEPLELGVGDPVRKHFCIGGLVKRETVDKRVVGLFSNDVYFVATK